MRVTGRFLDEVLRLRMIVEQRLDLTAKRVVRSAGSGKKRRALGGVAFEC